MLTVLSSNSLKIKTVYNPQSYIPDGILDRIYPCPQTSNTWRKIKTKWFTRTSVAKERLSSCQSPFRGGRILYARTNSTSATVNVKLARIGARVVRVYPRSSRPLIIIPTITLLRFRIQLLSRSIVPARKIHAKMSGIKINRARCFLEIEAFGYLSPTLTDLRAWAF